MAKKKLKKNSKMGEKATRLGMSVLGGVLTDKGLGFLNAQPFMAGEPGKMNLKRLGAETAAAVAGSAVALLVDMPMAEGFGGGMATAAANKLADEGLAQLSGKAMGSPAEDYLKLYQKDMGRTDIQLGNTEIRV